MIGSDTIARAGDVLRDAAARAIVPRFRALRDGDVAEKSADDPVTIADREAEALIAAGLAGVLPGSRVVGEEACAADARLIDSVGEGLVWLVDPLDGTANFVAGDPAIAVMAALLRDGETIAALILDPLTGRLCAAERGSGAWIDGVRFSTDPALPAFDEWAWVMGRFMPDEVADEVARRLDALPPPVPTVRAAGAEYPLIATGARQAAWYWRTLAWDHAPGVLFLNEAGGKATRRDCSEFRADRPGNGLIAACNPAVWGEMRRLLGD